MARRSRNEMIVETRAKLVASARQAFAEQGYAGAVMDEITESAGLTRGALYHHFGDKRGLFAAVVAQMDEEIDMRLQAISNGADDAWTALRERCRVYLSLVLEPEVRRVVLRDARAVLGERSSDSHSHCVKSVQGMLEQLHASGVVRVMDCEALACMLHGGLEATAFWIAAAEEPQARLARGLAMVDGILEGMRAK